MSSTLVALTAFSVQAAYGMPVRSAQTIRAVSCCATRCGHAKSPAAAGHCCGVAGAESERAVSSQVKLPDSGVAPHTLPVELGASSGLDAPTSDCLGAIPPARARGAPLFLLTHSLRI
jgi:hypothetical protein